MSNACNKNIKRILDLSREMIAIADEGDADREDASCGILYGVLRDSAYRLKRLAEEEVEKHRGTGKWD